MRAVQDEDRPRFDRPAAAPDSDAERVEEPFRPDELLKPRPAPSETPQPAASASRSKRSPRPERVESDEVTDEEPERTRQSRRAVEPDQAKPPALSPSAPQRGSRSARQRERSVDEQSDDAEDPDVDLHKPAHPIIVKSRPLGRPSSRPAQPSPTPSPSPSPPPPPQARSSRSARRARSPFPEPDNQAREDQSPASSRSPSPAPPARSSRRTEPTQGNQRQRSRRRQPQEDSDPSRSPSPAPTRTAPSRSSRKPRSPSPVDAKALGRSPSASPPPRRRRVEAEVDRAKVESVRRKTRGRSSSRSRSRSPSPPPTERVSRSARSSRPVDKERKGDSPRRPRSTSRSPSPPPREKTRRARSSPPRPKRAHQAESDVEAAVPVRCGRSSVRPTPAPAPTPSAPLLERTPSWRSVSRNRHRRDDSDDDTLVRGNLDDHELDIPAGGETTLLEAKRRAAVKDRSARRPRVRDEGFDPAVVAQPSPAPPKQTAKDVLGGWIKSVAALVKTEGELVVGEVEEKVLEAEVETDEARLKRKEERMKRRAARAARRAARADAEAQHDAAEASQARTQRRVIERAEDERKHKERDDKASEKRDVAIREDRERRSHSERSRAERPRASSRRRSPSRSASDSEALPAPASRRRVEPAEPDRARVRSSRHRHHGSSNVESPSELDDEAGPARPPVRQRAMSVSATVESGLRGLRDSVAKMVSGAHEVEAKVEDKVHYRSTRSSDPKDADRRRKDGSDSEVEHVRPAKHERESRSGRPSLAVESEGDRRRRDKARETSPPPATSSRRNHRQWDSIDAPPKQAARQARRARAEPSESEESSAPPPRRPHVESDTEASELPSRPSSRLTVRSESEGDGPVHRLAKLNAARASFPHSARSGRLELTRPIAVNAAPVEPAEHKTSRVRSAVASPSTARALVSPSSSAREDRQENRDGQQQHRRGRRLLDELRDDVERIEHKAVDAFRHHEPPRHAHSHESDHAPRSLRRDSYEHEPRAAHGAAPAVRDARRPALHVPPAQPHSALPPIPSPLSAGTPAYPYAYDRSNVPFRPQPVKPASSYGGAPISQAQQRCVPPPSSVGSSDEGDLSRPASGLRRARSGYLTASGSEVDDARSGPVESGRQRGGEASESEPENGRMRGYERDRRRFDRSPSPSPTPSPPPAPQTITKRHSFSRTGGSYPFSGDESSDDLSASSDEDYDDDDDGASSRYGPSSTGGHSSRTRVSSVAPAGSAPPSAQTREPYRAAAGGSRTMVSAPTAAAAAAPSRSTGRTTVSSPALSADTAPYRRQHGAYSRQYQTPYAYDGRDALSPSSSSAHSALRPRPDLSSPSPTSPASTPYRLSPSQLLSREGPSGFTGFDARGSQREADDAQFERDERERDRDRERERERRERGRLMKQGLASGSAKRFGEHGAPVGRRMASRLGL